MPRKRSKDNSTFAGSEKEKKQSEDILNKYRASWMHKDTLGMMKLWTKCENYWAGDVNAPEDDDDPGSNTNIIQPIIESLVADTVNGEMDLLVKGGPSEEPHIKDEQQRLKWVYYKNKMITKLDEGERDRLNLGTVGWQVQYNPQALNGRGLVEINPCSPDQLFPDPKIKNARNLNDGDFFIRTIPYPLGALRRRFGKRARDVKPEGNFTPYSPLIFGENDDNATEVINDQCLLYEYWEHAENDDEENTTSLRRVYMAGGIILEDSDWTHKEGKTREPFYSHNKYPFVLICDYTKKGRLWGISDNEMLIPTQEMINDLDDQIRMNARLMGNLQFVVGVGAGINLKKWTNKPGLKVQAKDHLAFTKVEPANIPQYIYQRRQQGFDESEIISGRSDVTEGRRAGSLRAASAIMALQEAGNRRSNHKKLMLQQGFVEITELASSCMREFMDVEQSFDLPNKDGNIDHLWSKPSEMNDINVKTKNEHFNPTSGASGTEIYKDLLEPQLSEETGETIPDEFGEPMMKKMTKEAEFDYEFSFGAGMPNSPSFLYQASIELARENLITQPEARQTLKDVLNWPIIDPNNPNGEFTGRNATAGDQANLNGQGPPQGGGQFPPGNMMPTEEVSVDQAMEMFMKAVDALPPEVLQGLVAQLSGMGGQFQQPPPEPQGGQQL